ncbi:MAG: FimB/Mfa2 family fimbrial subunit [Muribaculaceae bacterium]|nr:FimB/Mfa2 family fimbrial subunit [Muribaculaceae bacterium]
MGATLAVAAMAGMVSCGAINDDLEPCPAGLKLRFVFDYNMLYANAFPSQVDCLTLFVYDAAGNLVAERTETTSVLADENWRMVIDLPAGSYTCVAYGGMECSKSTFHFVTDPTIGSSFNALSVAMNSDCINAKPGKELHPLFYGKLSTTVDPKALDYTEATVYMMKDTNTIRVLLQNVDGTPVNVSDFTFAITDDNTLLNCNNDVVPQQGITYSPWYTGQATAGTVDGETTEAVLAVAQFSTSRLTTNTAPRLIITDNRNSEAVLSIPLVNYLLLLRSENPAYANMPAQEFLDREDTWRMILFLDNGRWIDTRIVINDWIVRLNNAEL